MNMQWGDKGIEWTDATWNPVTGCKNTCSYCYARKIATRFKGTKAFPNGFEPTFHPERLEEPYKLKKPAKIFVCSMGELFGPWVPREWQEAVIKVARENPQHIFQFLSKMPLGYELLGFPENAWLGVTLTSNRDRNIRAKFLIATGAKGNYRFISFEPLLGPVHEFSLRNGIDWVIIGAQTNPERQPAQKWVDDLLAEADYWRVPVFMKDNLDYEPKRREWPFHRNPEGKGAHR